MGTLKSVGRIYQQTFIDTYSKVAFARLYDRRNALVAADLLNDRVVPFFEKTKARSPQSNGICERFHKTVLDEFYRVTFREKLYNTLDELQEDLDIWLRHYNEEHVHSGKYCFGKTPMQTFRDSIPLVKE